MQRLVAVLVVGLIVAGCDLRTDRLRPSENGVWIGVKDTSYDEFFKAANTVMARRFKVTDSDPEMGTIFAQDNKSTFLWNERVGFFVWPTESSDAGYSVDFGGFVGSGWKENQADWKKIIIDDLKKELGAT